MQFAVLPPLIIHLLLRIVTGRGSAVRAGLWLGLLVSAQIFIGEELLADTAVAAVVMVVVLALGRPRTAAREVRARAGAMAAGLGSALAVAAVICGYPLWVQLHGPLSEHGSPWTVSSFHSYPYGFVTPSGALLFHTAASAATAARYPEPSPEYLAYLGWPLLIVAVVAAIAFWRDARVRLAAVTFALLELFSFGDVPVRLFGVRFPVTVLPWHWIGANAVLSNVLADRFCHPGRRRRGRPAGLRAGPGARPRAVQQARPAGGLRRGRSGGARRPAAHPASAGRRRRARRAGRLAGHLRPAPARDKRARADHPRLAVRAKLAVRDRRTGFDRRRRRLHRAWPRRAGHQLYLRTAADG